MRQPLYPRPAYAPARPLLGKYLYDVNMDYAFCSGAVMLAVG